MTQPGFDHIHSGMNGPTAVSRLEALKREAVTAAFPAPSELTNNHIHTAYSFSPYSPSAAAFMAKSAGLCTAGIMDHDSVAGAREFLSACGIVGIAATVGVEMRVSFRHTPFGEKRINNPDQSGCVYMALHGIPHTKIDRVQSALAPYRAHREDRNRRMTQKLNGLIAKAGFTLDYDRDIVPLSQKHEGGSVTERHISCALANAILSAQSAGPALPGYLVEKLGMKPSAKLAALLSDSSNAFAMYDLLGLIKSDLVPAFYIEATDECPLVEEALRLSEEVGAISAYAYLGDVGDSVTGDKRAQKFEDDYLDELFAYIARLGYRSVTYMPSRNTRAQLERVQALCRAHGFFEISGEDINQPRQSFICTAMEDPLFAHLKDAAWALIAHERRATADAGDGLFCDKNTTAMPDLAARVKAFADFARAT